LPGLKKLKGQILKNDKRPNFLLKLVKATKHKMFKICSDFSKTYYFLSAFEKPKNWQNHFISGKQFQKRPNGNPEGHSLLFFKGVIFLALLYKQNLHSKMY